MATSALAKLRDTSKKAQIITAEANNPWASEGDLMLISTPAEVDELMRQVPAGRVTTTNAIRNALSQKHNVAVACPLTTGIFTSISMRASEELAQMGATDITAWWRTVKSDGSLNPKAPGGVDGHKARLEAEGVEIERKGRKNWRVAELDELLFELEG